MKKLDFLPNKLNKYSIRKFTVGTASILIGSLIFLGNDASAAEADTDSINTTEESNSANELTVTETSTHVNATTEQPSTQEEATTPTQDEVTTEQPSTQEEATTPTQDEVTTEQPTEESSSTTSTKDNTPQDTTSKSSDATIQSESTTSNSSTKSSTNRTPTTFSLDSANTISSTGGSLVNDKVHVTNASLTLNQKNNQHDDNTIWPTSNEQFRLSADYELDNSITEGDKFTIKYGDYIRPGALELPAKNTQLRSKEGSIIANGVYDETTNTTTYTFTNYVNQYQNIRGSFNLLATPKRETVTKDNQTYPMDVTIANQEVRENFVVDYGNKKDHITNAAVANVDNVNNKHNEVVYLNQPGNKIYDAKYFSTVQNGTFIPGEIKVYEVLDENVLVDSFTPNLDGTGVKDVTSQFTPQYSLNNTRVDIDLNRSNMNKGKRYIITQAVRPSGTGNVTTNYYLTRYGNPESRHPTGAKSTTVSNVNGSSTGEGDNPVYSLGDYVWLDKNKDGIQDGDEKGIPGVYVILKDSNNKELQRATTDDKGHYKFDNLQNGTYFVEFVIPDNYTPSPSNASDNDAIDSDGQKVDDKNVVVAKGIIDNADNMTVDTGFYETPSGSLSESESLSESISESESLSNSISETESESGSESISESDSISESESILEGEQNILENQYDVSDNHNGADVEKLPDTGEEKSSSGLIASLLGLSGLALFRRGKNKDEGYNNNN